MSNVKGERFLSLFSEPVQESIIDRSLLEFETNPNKIIHSRSGTDQEKTYELYREGQKVFKVLRDVYDIPVPEFNYIFAPLEPGRKGEFTVYTVRDKIHGTSLKERLPADDGEVQKRLDTFFTNLFKFYKDIYTDGGNYLTDVPPQQFVYGRKIEEDEDRVYLIDTDPWYEVYNPHIESPYNSNFFHTLVTLVECLKSVEEKNQLSLVNARALLKDFVSSIKETDQNKEYLTTLKKSCEIT